MIHVGSGYAGGCIGVYSGLPLTDDLIKTLAAPKSIGKLAVLPSEAENKGRSRPVGMAVRSSAFAHGRLCQAYAKLEIPSSQVFATEF